MQKKLLKFNFIKSFLENVKKNPDNIFIVSDNEEITYKKYYQGDI